jgi:hypothetical protein
MPNAITWTNTTVKLGDLKPWADNPKLSTKAQAKRILDSWQKFGQVMTVAIGPSNEVYDGHQRLSVLLTLYGPGYEVDARQASRHLTDDERRAMVLALTNATGSWNWQTLSGWTVDELKEGGMEWDTLQGWNNDALNLREMLNSDTPQIDYAAEWEGMPEFNSEDLSAVKSLKVNFRSLDDVRAFAELVGQTLTEKTRFIWYP